MANISWFANSASLKVGSATVAAIRNVRMTPHFEVAELYGMESLLRQGAARYQFSVDVNVEYAMWDPTNDQIMASYLYGSSTTANPAVLNDGGCRSRTATFTITATVKDTSCASTLTIEATDVYFNDITVELRENEFISRNMTGKGANFTMTYS